ALEVAEGGGADRADARVLVLDGGETVLALGLDAGELELLGEDVGELLEGDVDLEDVLALGLAALALVADAVALAALAHADAAGVVAVAEGGDVDVAHGDGDEAAAFLADQLAPGEEAAEVTADTAADDLAEAVVVLFDLVEHR